MDLAERVAELSQSFVEAKKNVGLAVGVVYEGQNHAYCYGSVEMNGLTPPDERTLFEIGSITKVFTTTLLADMHLKGEVDLDDPVNKFLPSGVALRSRGGVEVTLRHLATHTSGLPRIPMNMGMKNLRSDNPYAKYTVDDLYAYISKRRPTFTPGTVCSYSNLGMGLLGHVLGLVAGMGYEELVLERICRPLGMVDTVITLSDDHRSRLAPGHAKGKQVPNWDLPTLAGCGALRSNIHDMLIFLNANIHPETTPLRDAIALAHTLQPRMKSHKFGWFLFILVEIGMLTSWATLGLGFLGNLAIFMVVLVIVARLSPMLIPTGDMRLGWQVKSLDNENLIVLFKVSSWKNAFKKKGWQVKSVDDGNGRVVWHNGATGGYRSYTGFVEGRDIGVVLLSNSTVPPDPAAIRLLNGLAAAKEGFERGT